MIDRTMVTSGFDTETVVSENYLTYLILAQVEAGLMSLESLDTDPVTGVQTITRLHPPPDYARLYNPDPSIVLPEPANRSFELTLLPPGDPGFLHTRVSVSFVDVATGREDGPFVMGLFINLELTSTPTDDGLEKDHAISLAFVSFDENTINLMRLVGKDPDKEAEKVRAQLDRSLPLGFAQNQSVQQIRMRKFVDGDQRSVGLYVNLALQSGPEPGSFRPPRGDVDLAQDFRPPDSPIAFASSPELFGLLGPDAKFRQAEKNEAGTGFRFPLREDPLNPDSDEVGVIKGISVGPEFGLAGPTGRLMIDVNGEYTDAPGDPDFDLLMLFDPVIKDGVVDWDLDVEVNLGLLATLLLIAAGIGLTLLFGPGLGLGSTLLVGTLMGLAVLKGLIAEPLAAKIVEDHLDSDNQASFLDALPFKVPAALRRWDPFYTTEHQVVALVDGVTIDLLGLAFEGRGLALGKQPVPVGFVVVRDEDRVAGTTRGLRYLVRDFVSLKKDLEAVGPGRDTLPYDRSDPSGEPLLVSLTDDQIADRIASKRLLAPITYTAERIFLVEGQIDGLLCLSRKEKDDARKRVISRFRTDTKNTLRQSLGDAIKAVVAAELQLQLGRPPTDAEVATAFEARLEELVTERQPAFEKNQLPGKLQEEVARVLRFDLIPEEMIKYQELGAVILDGKEIIGRHSEDGTVKKYYRDHPDGDPRDNLLSLPHYVPPYQPPA